MLVTGLGPVGQAASLLATQLGCRVVGADITEERCGRARGLGTLRPEPRKVSFLLKLRTSQIDGESHLKCGGLHTNVTLSTN